MLCSYEYSEYDPQTRGREHGLYAGWMLGSVGLNKDLGYVIQYWCSSYGVLIFLSLTNDAKTFNMSSNETWKGRIHI